MSGSQRYSVAAVARLLGISERGVRDRIERGTLDAIKESGHRGWRILLPPEAAPEAVVPTAPGGSSRGSDAVGDAVATPAVVEQAIARTGQQYTADLRAMLADLREVYEGQIAAKDETIAELRRRAALAEEELARLHRADEAARRREDSAYETRQDAQDPQDALDRQGVREEVPPGLWTQLRRWWRS